MDTNELRDPNLQNSDEPKRCARRRQLLVGHDTGTMAEKPLAPYGEGNSFPREATNTDDWLDAIGLVWSAPLPSQNPITKHECGVRLPAEPLQDSSRGYELGGRREHDRKRED